MHAILSLGATHYALAAPPGTDYKHTAISHRGKALEHLSNALTKVDNCTDMDLDGILATCYTLVFQAYYMTDGLTDFAVMIRGCGMVTNYINSRFNGSKMFLLQTPEQVSELVAPWLSADAHPDQKVLDACTSDIDKLRPFLQGGGTQGFFNCLRKVYVALGHSVRDSFVCLTEVYTIWYTMDNHEFMMFIASANHVVRALFLHYLAIDTLMGPFMLSIRGRQREQFSLLYGAAIKDQWAHTIYYSLPANMRAVVKHEADLIGLRKYKFVSCF
jgi:hypothetical protein